MRTQMGKVSKETIIARLERDGMDRELATKMVDAASKLIPRGAFVDDSVPPLALFLYGIAAGFAQSAATFIDTSPKLDDGEECSSTKAETMRNTAILLNVAAMMAAALAESVDGADEPEVPQA